MLVVSRVHDDLVMEWMFMVTRACASLNVTTAGVEMFGV